MKSKYSASLEDTFLIEDPKQKEKYVLVLLIKEIFSQIDEVASLRSQGSKASISMQLLREICSVLRELDPDLEEEYFNILITLAGHTKEPSEVVYNDEFAENVVIAKQRFIEKVRKALQRQAA